MYKKKQKHFEYLIRRSWKTTKKTYDSKERQNGLFPGEPCKLLNK